MGRILAFSGSARKQSYNQALVTVMADVCRQLGAEVTVVTLADYPAPLYDGDWETENGLPDSMRQLKTLMKQHDGLLIACPEYNSSITPLLKNTIDWASRQEEGEAPLACYQGKVAALAAASPGKLGGLRGLFHVRDILQNIGVMVVPNMVAVSEAHRWLGPDAPETLADNAATWRMVQQTCQPLVNAVNARALAGV